MPPKLSPVQIDEKLERLHESVCDHVGLLAGRNGASLRACLRQTASAEESRWYQFLCKNANAFSESQNDRVRRAYALLEEHWLSVAPRAAVLPEPVATQGEKPLADQGQATVLAEPVAAQREGQEGEESDARDLEVAQRRGAKRKPQESAGGDLMRAWEAVKNQGVRAAPAQHLCSQGTRLEETAML